MSQTEEMKLTFNELTKIYPKQIWIELLPKNQKEIWQKIEDYSNSASRWNAYLNYTTLYNFINWIKEDHDIPDHPQIWPTEEDLPSFWEIVNGTKLTLCETKFVIIPTDKSNLSEFRIPQEWVDIPNWTANYYLAVQINFDDNWMRVCGYTTYEKIRKQRFQVENLFI